jgi:hypothetical protein
MSKIVIYKGVYQYDAVNIFAEELSKGFNDLGYETVYVDLTDSANLNANLGRELSGPCDFVIGFGAVGSTFETNGKSLCDMLPYPYVAELVDHPAHHLDRLHINNIIITTIDRSHVTFLNRYFEGRKKVAYLPHGGCLCEETEVCDRTIDILFAGTYMDRNRCYSEITKLDEILFKFALDTSEIVLSKNSIPLEKALEEAGENLGIDIYEKAIYERLAKEVVPKIELFVRAEKRMKILSIMDNAEIKMDIYGNGWPDNIFKNHRMNKALGFDEILKLMRRSKIVLNMANLPDGSHERVFSAMLNGALMFSDYNTYLEEIFEEDNEIAFYRWMELEKMPEKADFLLSNPDEIERIASNGKIKAEKDHTWKSRAETLLKIVDQFKTGQ